jgi:ADP-dependent NAD(P)H-hydrate dehydratase
MPHPSAETVTPALLRDWPLPDAGGGKEGRGRTLVVGGSPETPGAALLAAEAALRCGAGKLQIATAESVAVAMALAVPEAMVRGLAETPSGAIAGGGAGRARDLAEAASCVLLGPGLTDPVESAALVRALIDGLHGPVVLDALALAAVTESIDCVRHLDGRVVLTPNPTELALTLHEDEQQVDDDPAAAALRLAERADAVVAVGGGTAWVAAPDGRLWRDDGGAPGLGVSGAGDVRAGLVAGLLARGAEPAQAAVWAGHLHGRAGERLSGRSGPLGFLARELAPEVPALLVEISQ